MQFDFTLAANGGQIIEARGSFVKYVSGTGKIRVRINQGGYLDLLPGQGARGLAFDRLTVEDRSGAGNVGVLLAGVFEFQDDRITGTVDTVDGGRNRTIANQAFIGTAAITGTAGNYPYAQLYNPAGSGKNLILKSATLGTSADAFADIRIYGTPMTNEGISAGAYNKRLGGGAGVGVMVQFNTPTHKAPVAMLSFALKAYSSQLIVFTEPVLIPPGAGICFDVNSPASVLIANAEWFEEAIG